MTASSWSGPDRRVHPHLDPGGVLALGAGGGQRQTGAAGDGRERLHGLVLLEEIGQRGDESVGDLEGRALGQLDLEGELALGEGRDQIDTEAGHEGDGAGEGRGGGGEHQEAVVQGAPAGACG